MTPKPVWNPDLPATEDFRAQWAEVPDNEVFDNGFKVQWEAFLRHVVDGGEFGWDFFAGARTQIADRLSTTMIPMSRSVVVYTIGLAASLFCAWKPRS